MLRVTVHEGSGGAKGYFTESLDRGDYYLDGQELPGRWRGKGAAMLGLSGEVTQRDFFALCDNLKPDGSKLTPRTKANRRVGYDFNFHCSKSVSIAYGMTGDTGILRIFESAVDSTMAMLESDMQVRVRLGGESIDRKSGNLVYGRFTHQTARPVGGTPDMHLHAHCFSFNASYDDKEDRWKAGQFGKIMENRPYYERCFHTQLRYELECSGYRCRDREDGFAFELDYISEAAVRTFSRRTKQVEEEVERLGIEDASLKDGVGARTRERKNQSWQMDDIREIWGAQLGEHERQSIAERRTILGRERNPDSEKEEPLDDEPSSGIVWSGEPPSPFPAAVTEKTTPSKPASIAIDFAARHHFERRAVVSENDILTTAMKQSKNRIHHATLKAALDGAGFIQRTIDEEEVVSSRDVLKEEQRMLDFARKGRGKHRSFAPAPYLKHKTISDHQYSVLKELLTSRDTVTILGGSSGSGKTYLMGALTDELRARSIKVGVFAPSAHAVSDNLRKNGSKESETIGKLLADKKMQKKMRGAVILIDDAGKLGTQALVEIMDVAKSCAARVVLFGDTGQHSSPIRGNPLRLLHRESGIQPSQLRVNNRNRNELASAVASLSKGKTEDGFDRLDGMGCISQYRNQELAHEALADDYVKATRGKRSAMVICPTHKEGDELNQCIRERMRKEKRLRGRERTVQRLVPLYFTDAQVQEGSCFKRNQVVHFHKKSRGVNAGERRVVLGRDPLGNVWLKGKTGPLLLNRKQCDRFAVYEPDKIKIAVGDSLRITRNGRDIIGKRLVRNGSVCKVAGFVPLSGDIMLTNGKMLPRNYGHFDHAYAATSHARQGKTADHVFVSQCKDSFGASTQEQFYVSASLGRQSVKFYTDWKAKLKECVAEQREDLSATELERFQGPVSVIAHKERIKKKHDRDRQHER